MPSLPPPGFYIDPSDASLDRWWDGTAWGDWTRPAGSVKEEEVPEEPAGPETAGLYAALGVHPGASAEEIKRAYREKARQHHPDVGGDAATFKEISHAYEVLSDTERRARYDQFGDFRGSQSSANYSVAAGALGVSLLGMRLSFWIEGSCGLFESDCRSFDWVATATSSGRSILAALVLFASLVLPVAAVLRAILLDVRARSSVVRELLGSARAVGGYGVAAFAALVGAQVSVVGGAWWRFAMAAGVWSVGYLLARLILPTGKLTPRLYLFGVLLVAGFYALIPHLR